MLGQLEDLAENQTEAYAKFWEAFGRVLKEGMGEDHANRERIAKLLRFASTHADTAVENVSLTEYVSRMKEGQDAIFYVTAETFNGARNSPHLEIFRRKGIEVLLFSDRVDEWMIAHLDQFDGKPLKSVAKGDLDLAKFADEAERKEQEATAGDVADVVGRIRSALGERVKDVRVSHRLTESPACLVADDNDIGTNLARILKAAGQKGPDTKPILEVNPGHAVLARMKDETDDIDDWSALLYEQALLAEGGQLEDPAGFVRRVNRLMLGAGGDRSRIVVPG